MTQKTGNRQLLVVLGATGNQGRAVLDGFVNDNERSIWKLRGVTRNRNSSKAKELTELGIEMVEGDLNDLDSIKRALKDATHLFATTDSNQLIFNAIKDSSLLKQDESPRSYAKRIEMQQGANIADAASSTPSLQRIVWSSLPSPKKWSHGKYTKVSMFDAKDEIADVLASTPGLKGKLSLLLIGFYATNPLHVPDLYAPHKQADGSYELALPMDGDKPVPIADLATDMGHWVEALFQAPAGVTLVGATQVMSWKGWLAAWAKDNKVKGEYRRASPEEFAAKIEGISEAVNEEFAFVDEYGFDGGNPKAVYPDDLRRRGINLPASTIEQQIRSCDWSSIL